VQICEWCDEHCTRLVKLVGSELEEAKGQRVIALASTLGALGSRHPDHVRTALPSILRRLITATPKGGSKHKNHDQIMEVELMDVAL
jgi:hypothetical protein